MVSPAGDTSHTRIIVHDYAGHAFPLQLSRELACRGHEVLHLYSASTHAPQGRLARRGDDPDRLHIRPIRLRAMIRKDAFIRRRFQEAAYGRLLVKEVEAYGPEVVLSGQTPLDAQRVLQAHCKATGCRLVHWAQDLYGVAAHRILRRRWPILGELIGRYYVSLERKLVRRSDGVVLISEDFREVLDGHLPPGQRTQVIPNWAPLDEVPLRPKNNEWARSHGLAERKVLLYAGTLGMKHNPGMLLALAWRLRERDDVHLVVVSEGWGATWLRDQVRLRQLTNVLFLGYQPFERMPDVLGAADVLVAVLEPEAGVFSVPSKVLTYLCAGRALLLAVPPQNLAARIVVSTGAGIVVTPDDEVCFAERAVRLLEDDAARSEMGREGRAYAEQMFDITAIADSFELAFWGVTKTAAVTPQVAVFQRQSQ